MGDNNKRDEHWVVAKCLCIEYVKMWIYGVCEEVYDGEWGNGRSGLLEKEWARDENGPCWVREFRNCAE